MFDPITEPHGIHTKNELRMTKRLEAEAGTIVRKVTVDSIRHVIAQVERQLGEVLQIPEAAWVGSTVYHCVAGPWYEDHRGVGGQSIRLTRREDGWWLTEINRETLACGKGAKARTVITVSESGKSEIPDFSRPPINVVDWK